MNGEPSRWYDITKIGVTCPHAWAIFATGRTKMIFQLESRLGEKWAKRIKPGNMEELSAVGALLRPGCLRAVDERGVSMTELYARRKNGEEPVVIEIDAIRHILEPTYGIACYQEQMMQIAQIIANFDLVQVDTLRKAAGKKDQSLMTEIGKVFVDQAEAHGVITREQAEALFENIKKSGRYLFNKCISFDTKMLRLGGGSPSPYTVEEMYRIRNDIAYAKATGHLSLYKKWKRLGNYGNGLSLQEDGRIRPNIIEDIQPAGIRLVYKITLANGATIRSTGNHKFPTTKGEMTLDKIVKNGLDVSLHVCGNYEVSDFKVVNRFSEYTNKDRYQGNGSFTNGSYSKFQEFRRSTPDVCFDCGCSDRRIETHHVNSDRTNSEPENLMKLCASCHKKRDYSLGRTKKGEKGYPSIAVPIYSVEPDGECMTYDITMRAPDHNFVVDSGIVTCNSHSVSYAMGGYWTAHYKTHFPVYCYTAYLHWAKEKQDPKKEIRALINDAKHFGIEVLPPRFSDLRMHFGTNNVEITFGLADISGLGDITVSKMREAVKEVEDRLGTPRTYWSWFDFLVYLAPEIGLGSVVPMIQAGALRDYKIDRLRLLAELDAFDRLTPTEKDNLAKLRQPLCKMQRLTKIENGKKVNLKDEKGRCLYKSTGEVLDDARPCNNLQDALAHLLERPGAVTERRRQTVQTLLDTLINPPSSLEDTPYYISTIEEQKLGVAITCSPVESGDRSRVNTTTKEFRDGKSSQKQMVMGVEILEYRENTVKTGKNAGRKMGYLQVADQTGELQDIAVYSDVWEKYSHLLVRNRTLVALGGKRHWDVTQSHMFVVENVWEM